MTVDKASDMFNIAFWYGPPWLFWAVGLGMILRALHVGRALFKPDHWKVDINKLLFFCLPMSLVLIYLYIPNIGKLPLPMNFYFLGLDIHHNQLMLNIFGYMLLSCFVSKSNKKQ